MIEDPWLLANELFAPCYIGGWSAAEHWALTEQIFRSTFIVTSGRVRHTEVVIHGAEFHVVRVRPRLVESVESTWRGKDRIRVSTPERTIADGLVAPAWLGGIRSVMDVLTSYRRSERWRPDRLLGELESIGIGTGFKRLGYLAEVSGIDGDIVRTAEARRTAGNSKLDPAIVSRGRLSKRWGLWVNASLTPTESD